MLSWKRRKRREWWSGSELNSPSEPSPPSAMSSTEPTSANGSQEAAAADASVVKALSTDVEGLEEDNVVYDLSDEDDVRPSLPPSSPNMFALAVV